MLVFQFASIYMLNTFTKDGQGGNLAGVVLDTNGLTTKAMQAIANKLNFSETAFVLPSVNTDYEMKYFTSNEEVAICGHATIATFSLLAQIRGISSKIYSIKTKAGVLSVGVHNNKKFSTFTFEQGYVMDKPSEILVNVSTNLGNITDVQVGGFASNF